MSHEAIIAKIELQPGEYRKPLLAFFTSRAGPAGQLASCAKPLGRTFTRASGFADLGKKFIAVEFPHQTDELRWGWSSSYNTDISCRQRAKWKFDFFEACAGA